jgi:transposase-like protein
VSHSEFLEALDAAILRGETLSQIARRYEVNQTTVSRRKAALREEGHRIPTKTQGYKHESLRQKRGVNHAVDNW